MHQQLRLLILQLFLDFRAMFFPEWPLIFLVITIHQVIGRVPVPSYIPPIIERSKLEDSWRRLFKKKKTFLQKQQQHKGYAEYFFPTPMPKPPGGPGGPTHSPKHPAKRLYFQLLAPTLKYMAPKFKYTAPKLKYVALELKYVAPKFKSFFSSSPPSFFSPPFPPSVLVKN